MKGIEFDKLKSYAKQELPQVCDALRQTIRQTVLQCGGHLASNLGAVESTVALFYAFDFPKDKIVFDVGHQCYAYKLLSGRADRFSTLRQKDGISGFPKRLESVYDCYDTGHAGTSISAALGLAKARDLSNGSEYVIAYIGDGSFNNGLVYEALNSLKILDTKILIVLNDNGMSISPTVGGMHEILTSLRDTDNEDKIRLLESFGLQYVGIRDGNDVFDMLDAIEETKTALQESSVLLHVSTTKGKGYAFSEEAPVATHGVAPSDSNNETEYGEILGNTLCALAKEDERITVVCAAMKESLGLSQFFDEFPQRAFDVGICEEHASVLSAALAIGGLKPYYAVYSTFLQRAFDEMIHDVCAQDLPMTICLDRSGISGADGETHQGVFDLSYLSLIPNLTIAAPKDTVELETLIRWSVTYAHPLVIRYPRAGKRRFIGECQPICAGKWEYLHRTNQAKVAVLGVGERALDIAMQASEALRVQGKDVDVINVRFCKPFDMQLLLERNYEHLVTIEDNVFIGGFGASLSAKLHQEDLPCSVRVFAYKDEFIPQGGVQALMTEYGVDLQEIVAYLMEVLQ